MAEKTPEFILMKNEDFCYFGRMIFTKNSNFGPSKSAKTEILTISKKTFFTGWHFILAFDWPLMWPLIWILFQ